MIRTQFHQVVPLAAKIVIGTRKSEHDLYLVLFISSSGGV